MSTERVSTSLSTELHHCVAAAFFLLLCACSDPSSSPDTMREPHSPNVNTACAVPEGAHPSVGPAIAANGWRCIRDPRPLLSPRDVLVTRNGDILVSEFGSGSIVRIGTDIQVLAQGLNAPIGLRELEDGTLLVAEEGRGSLARIDPQSGERTEIVASLGAVTYLTIGPDGAAYVSSFREVAPTGTGIVWRVDLDSGESSPFASGLNVPEGLLFEGGLLRVVEWYRPSAVLQFAAGGGSQGSSLSDGYNEAYGLLSDGHGGYYVGDHAGQVVWEQANGDSVVLVSGIGKPGGMARTADGALLIAEFVDFGATGYLVRLEPEQEQR